MWEEHQVQENAEVTLCDGTLETITEFSHIPVEIS